MVVRGNRLLRLSLISFGLLLLVGWSLLPIAWNVMTSLKNRTDIFTSPPRIFFTPNFEAYEVALGPTTSSIYRNMGNSVIVALGATFLTLVVSSAAAYALSKFRFAGRRAMLYLVLMTRLLPPISAVIPLFVLMNSLRLVDTHTALILIYTALSIPFAVWLLKAFFDAIPRELEECARVEGCNALQAFRHVTLPLAAPGLSTTAVFVFVLAWNEFLFAFLFTSVEARTMPVLIAQARGDDQFLWQQMSAQTTLLMLPALFMGLYLQRYLVKGLTAGAVK